MRIDEAGRDGRVARGCDLVGTDETVVDAPSEHDGDLARDAVNDFVIETSAVRTRDDESGNVPVFESRFEEAGVELLLAV